VNYVHVEITCHQTSKRPGAPCGDVVAWERTPAHTTILVSDGVGSGTRANLAATMCVSRLQELLRRGFSLREAFSNVVRTMEKAKDPDLPYAVFTALRILNDGEATLLTYEMPAPVLVERRYASVLTPRMLPVESTFVAEVNTHLGPGEAILVVSDGITQSGIGGKLRDGWRIEGVTRYLTDHLGQGAALPDLPRLVHAQARRHWGEVSGDDCTVMLAACRPGHTVCLFTGPPREPRQDRAVVAEFLALPGVKVVCGGTTAKLVADYLGKPLTVEQDPDSFIAPPHYHLEGVDLVTEGAVTLNQVYNILEADPNSYDEDSGVTRMCELLRGADRVVFLVGGAFNEATTDIAFRQRGILTRDKIVPLLAEKLRAAGKLVVIESR
jgi:hypothetical protein